MSAVTRPLRAMPDHPLLGAVCLAALALPLSFTGGAVATPAIARDLGGDPAALLWITNAFMLTFGASLMAAGSLADRYGRKRVFALGVGGFAVTSLALGAAPTLLLLDLLRGLQGLAAAAALAGGTAALAQEGEGRARVRAFSLVGTAFGLGLAFGPPLTGLLIDLLHWRAIFLSGTLLALLALGLGLPHMRETRDPAAGRLDWPGLLLFSATLGCLTVAVVEAPSEGWASYPVLALSAAVLVLLLGFVLVERRAHRPMLDLSLFRYRRFIGVQLLPVATCASYVVLLVVLPLRFIGIEGLNEIEAGLLMVALSAPMLAVPLLAANLTAWISPGLLSGGGLLLAALGLLWLGRVDPGEGAFASAAPMLLIGFGTAFPWGLMDGLSVSVVPKERAGMATGIFSTVRVAGEGVSLALVNALLAALTLSGLSLTATGDLAEAARFLAAGDLAQAAGLLPDLARSRLIEAYAAAFRDLTSLLALVTFVSALAILALLGRRSGEGPSGLS